MGETPLGGPAGGGRGGGGGKVREGLLEAGGGGGGAGKLGRPGPAAAREVLGGSSGTAALGPSVGCEGILLALAVLLLGGTEVLGAAARTPGSCPGLPAEKHIAHRSHQDFIPTHQAKQCKEEVLHHPLASGYSE